MTIEIHKQYSILQQQSNYFPIKYQSKTQITISPPQKSSPSKTSILKITIKLLNKYRQLYDNIFYYQTIVTPQEMTNPNPRNYSPYSPSNYTPNDAQPLRTKAFSHLDNIGYNPSQYQNSPSLNNQDKVSQIKKKYDKLFNKSSSKANDQNCHTFVEPDRSISAFGTGTESSKWNQSTSKYNVTTSLHKQAKFNDPIEDQVKVSIINRDSRDLYKKEVTPSRNVELRSQLQNNRTTLQSMKSELQSKLSDLSAKTNISSNIKNMPNISPNPKNYDKLNEEENRTYEAIISKYSKTGTQHKNDRNATYSKQAQKKYNEISKNYTSKYDTKERITSMTEQQKIRKQQLSIISEISNSNNSECLKDNSNQFDQRQILNRKNKIDKSYIKINNNFDQTFKKNAQSNLIITKTDELYDDKNWFKNTTSYFKDVQKTDNHIPVTYNRQQSKHNMEFTLKKLQNSQGFTIKRTVTQQNFMNMNKANFIQSRNQPKAKLENNYMNTRQTPLKYESKYAPIAQEYTKQAMNNSYINSTPQTYQQNQPNQTNQTNHPTHKASYSYSKTPQKEIDNERSEIQKLKEKYNISGSSNYQEKNQKIQDIVSKVEPRNNELISKEIQKLDQKIRQIQQNKRDLNINFKPYEVSKSAPKVPQPPKSKGLQKSYEMPIEKQIQKIDRPIIDKNNARHYVQRYNAVTPLPLAPTTNSSTANIDRYTKYNARHQNYLQKIKPIYSEITLPQTSKTHSTFAIKLFPVQNQNPRDDETTTQKSFSQISNKSRTKQYLNKMEIQNRTDNGMEQRKKRLQDKVQINNTIKCLVKVFGQQAVFDQLFRNNKIWFASENRNNKWDDLKMELHKNKVNVSQSQLKDQFQLFQSENNPFFSVSDNKCDLKTLVQSYLQAKRHWQQKIVGQFNKSELIKQGFRCNKIDFDKKGYIQIEDLVRFLNIESGTFLRNRDVSIIFRRINKQTDKIKFQDLLQIVSQ